MRFIGLSDARVCFSRNLSHTWCCFFESACHVIYILARPPPAITCFLVTWTLCRDSQVLSKKVNLAWQTRRAPLPSRRSLLVLMMHGKLNWHLVPLTICTQLCCMDGVWQTRTALPSLRFLSPMQPGVWFMRPCALCGWYFSRREICVFEWSKYCQF